MTTTVSLSFTALTIDSADPAALADFWGKALGRPVSPGSGGLVENHPGAGFGAGGVDRGVSGDHARAD